MKTILLTIFTITLSTATIGQTTSIPDANFEQALIDLGLDTGTPDGNVLTASVDTVTYLSVANKNISNLTGIEDFTSLTSLICASNQLSSVDISQNIALTFLNCGDNLLTSIDVSQNSALNFIVINQNLLTSINISQNQNLEGLICSYNSLSNLDVTQNSALLVLHCHENQLSSLDVSENTVLKDLSIGGNAITDIDLSNNANLVFFLCAFNPLTHIDVSQNSSLARIKCSNTSLTTLDVSQNSALTKFECDNTTLNCLNVKNGNNSDFFVFSALNNPDLTCIQVDNSLYSSSNWTNRDAGVIFSTNCPSSCTVGLNENSLPNISIYPNPTKGNITIDFGGLSMKANATLSNQMGQVVFSKSLDTGNLVILNLTYPTGIYHLTLETESEMVCKKVIIE
jgi:hypothetical protein